MGHTSLETVYLDNNGTTMVAPEVFDSMLPFLRQEYGNPSSLSSGGRRAKAAIEIARGQVAEMLGCDTDEIFFTSGGSESINTAVLGALAARPGGPKRIVTSSVEHPAMREMAKHLEMQGYDVIYIPVDASGRLDMEYYTEAIRKPTSLVSLMWANNETGVVFPVPTAAALAHEHDCVFHTDAVQAAGKVEINASEMRIDLLSISGHKFHGPKGVGALFKRKGFRLAPLIRGGHQERGLRAGTENVSSIVGMGKACESACKDRQTAMPRIRMLRDRLEQDLLGRDSSVAVYGRGAERIGNTLMVGFPGVQGKTLVERLEQSGITASTGSVCSSESLDPSHVLLAMGATPDESASVIRLSLSRYTTPEEVDHTARTIWAAVKELRTLRL